MAIPPPDPNFTGAQKTAYAQQYGGTWEGSRYNPTGVATAPKPAAPKPVKPAALVPSSSSSYTMTSTAKPGPSAGEIGMTSSTPNVTPAGGQTVQSQFRNALLGQLNTDPNNVSLNDPGLKPQMQAFTNAQQRSQERAQQELAEQAFAGGTRGTGAYGAELGAMEQQRGENEAQFGAGLLGQERQQRLASLFQALGLGGEQLTADEALRLQRELGIGDLNVRGQANANQLQLGQGQLGLGLLQALLSDRQHGSSLGLQAALGKGQLNLQSILPFIK
jgi:hypothetical protein